MGFLHRARLLARHIGIDVSRWPVFRPEDPIHLLVRQMEVHQVDVVLDVGAHHGVYGDQLRQAGYRGRIVSFEPLNELFSMLKSHTDKLWEAYRYAIGDRNGTVTLNVAGNEGGSSSVLPMLPAHIDAAPDAVYIGTEDVEIRTIDTLASEILHPGDRVFLKADVQGYERAVLAGAKRVLDEQCVGLQLEMSLTPLYEGSMLYREAIDIVEGLGFTLAGVAPVFSDLRTGRMLQVDGVFFRE